MRIGRSPSAFAAALACAALGAVSSGCGGDPEPRAIAFTEADGVLTVVAGTFSRTCEESTSIIIECGRWELAVHMKPAAQSGERPIASADTWAEKVFSDGGPSSKECSVYGDTYDQGKIEITSISNDTVQYTLTGTAQGTFDADGTYEATRCK